MLENLSNMVHQNSKNNLKPITKETAADFANLRAEKRQQREFITFNRSNVLKEIFAQPLTDLFKYSKQFKKVIENKFDDADNLTVFEAIQINSIMHYLSSNDVRVLDSIMNSAFGKLREEQDKKTIEIPVFQDPISIIQEMPADQLKLLFQSVAHKLEPITEQNTNDNIIINNLSE